MATDSTRAADTIEPTGNIEIDGLLTGTKWAQDPGASTTTLTYGFPTKPSQYDGYAEGEEPSNNFKPLTDFQQNYFKGLLDNLMTATNLRFKEMKGDEAGQAAIRLGWMEDSDEGTVAWAMSPENSPYGGDVWLNGKSFSPTSTKISDNEVGVIMHEFGHALGLKHPHDEEGEFKKLPESLDGPEHTSLTYNFSAKFKDAYESDLMPQTYMWLDIQAFQKMYGKNMTTTAGADTYAFDLAERHFLTIWDAGGRDTIHVKNGKADLSIDLTPGSWSDIGTTVNYKTDSSGDQALSKTLFIAPDTTIEKAIGADGNDTIKGNDANNGLKGNGGNDSLEGGKGNDFLSGGAGSDTLSGGDGNDQLWAGSGDASNDTMLGGAGADTIGGGKGADKIEAGSGDDIVYGGKGDVGASGTNDVITGGDGADLVFASGGNDSVAGGSGNDTLFGGVGNDTLDGGAGQDTLWGGDGNDQLTGGTGKDTFAFKSGNGDDMVKDFKVGEDVLALAQTKTDFNSVSDVQSVAKTSQVGGATGVLIDTGGGDSVFLEGISINDLTNMIYDFG